MGGTRKEIIVDNPMTFGEVMAVVAVDALTHGTSKKDSCDVCGGKLAKSFGEAYCPACLEREEAERIVKEREANRLAIEVAGLPERYKAAEFANCPELKAVSAVKAWVKSRMGIIVIRGKCGKGKTYLAAAAKKEFNRSGIKSIFTTESDMVLSIKRAFDKDSTVTEYEAYRSFMRSGPLIIDDVGVSKSSEFVLSVWDTIINERYSNNCPTLINTNLDVDTLTGHVGVRVMERIRESKMIYTFPDNAKNWRD